MANDPLNDLSMKPTRDDLASRQQVNKKGRKRSHSVDLEPGAVAQGNRNGPIVLVLLLIVAGASAGGWFMWHEMESLSAELRHSKEILTESQSSMGDLQQNLASQSENLNKTGSQVEADLKLHFSEIRKLWDLSNKTNKPAIEKNTKTLASLKSSISQQKKLLSEATKNAAAAQSGLKSIENQLKEDQLQASVINSQVSDLEAQIGELTAQNKAFKNMLKSQEATIDTLQKSSGAALQAKLNEISQRLDSIDAHRRQVNARLDQHERNITELYKKP